MALLLILFFAVDLSLFPALGWTPISGGLGANLRSLTLPALSLGFPIGCFYTRLLRADVLEQLHEDYVVTAHAKGLPAGGAAAARDPELDVRADHGGRH